MDVLLVTLPVPLLAPSFVGMEVEGFWVSLRADVESLLLTLDAVTRRLAGRDMGSWVENSLSAQSVEINLFAVCSNL